MQAIYGCVLKWGDLQCSLWKREIDQHQKLLGQGVFLYTYLQSMERLGAVRYGSSTFLHRPKRPVEGQPSFRGAAQATKTTGARGLK